MEKHPYLLGSSVGYQSTIILTAHYWKDTGENVLEQKTNFISYLHLISRHSLIKFWEIRIKRSVLCIFFYHPYAKWNVEAYMPTLSSRIYNAAILPSIEKKIHQLEWFLNRIPQIQGGSSYNGGKRLGRIQSQHISKFGETITVEECNDLLVSPSAVHKIHYGYWSDPAGLFLCHVELDWGVQLFKSFGFIWKTIKRHFFNAFI